MNDKAITPYQQLKGLVKQDEIMERFQLLLGERAGQFLGSLLTVVGGNKDLLACDPFSILSAAAKAAALDLPVDPNLGLAYIIPYKGKATFQLGYRAYVQLCLRTGKYEAINTIEVYEGETVTEHRLSGAVSLTGTPTSDKIIGYAAYFKLLSGFEKAVYWPIEKVREHAQKFSPTYSKQEGKFYNSSAWATSFNEMAKKTVLKYLLNHYGQMTVGDREKLMELESADQEPSEDVVDSFARDVSEDEPFVPEPETEVVADPATGEMEPPPMAEVLVAAGVCQDEKEANSWLALKRADKTDDIVWAKTVRAWLDSNMATLPQAVKFANQGKQP